MEGTRKRLERQVRPNCWGLPSPDLFVKDFRLLLGLWEVMFFAQMSDVSGKASDGSRGPGGAETLKVTKGGKPGCSMRSGKSATENTAKAEYCRLAEGRKQRLSLLTPSRTARLRRLMLARSQSNRMRSAGGKRLALSCLLLKDANSKLDQGVSKKPPNPVSK